MHRVLLRFTQRISSGEAALATATLLQLRPWLIPGEDEEGAAWRCGQQAAMALADWIGQQPATCETTKRDLTSVD